MKKTLLLLLLVLPFTSWAQDHSSIIAFDVPYLENTADWAIPPAFSGGTNDASVENRTIDPLLATALQEVLDSMQQQMGIIGLSAALRVPEGDIWASGSGIGAADPEEEVTAEMRTSIGSISKTLTAACILSLYEEELLTLDDSLHQWLPTYEHIDSSITIRQLLNHTSGIHNYTNHPDFFSTISATAAAFEQIWTVPEVLAEFVNEPTFQPGLDWGYSNTNYILLGEIIEAATGNTYYEEIRTRLLEPLDLTTIFIPPYDDWQTPTLHYFSQNDADPELEDIHYLWEGWASIHSSAGAAGAYYATPSDMTRWMQAYQTGALHSDETIEESRDVIYLNPNTSYGLGITKQQYLGYEAWGHGGDLGYSSSNFYLPELDLSFSVHGNDVNFYSFDMEPVIAALLEVYLDYQQMVNTADVEAAQFQLSATPNPCGGNLQIHYWLPTNTTINMSVTTLTGQVILNEQQAAMRGQHTFNINTDTWPNGVYSMQMQIGQTMISERIIKL